MYTISIFSVGKNKEPWLVDALAVYETRLRPALKIEWNLFKTEEKLYHAIERLPKFICLDVSGKEFTSESFANILFEKLKQHGSHLNFLIGASNGIPDTIREAATNRICLSKLTLTHQMVRLLFLEQIYRAFEIQKGSSYHK